jgi:hypothetical protein
MFAIVKAAVFGGLMIMVNGVVAILIVFWILLSSFLGWNTPDSTCIRTGQDWDAEAEVCNITDSYYWTENFVGFRTYYYLGQKDRHPDRSNYNELNDYYF